MGIDKISNSILFGRSSLFYGRKFHLHFDISVVWIKYQA